VDVGPEFFAGCFVDVLHNLIVFRDRETPGKVPMLVIDEEEVCHYFLDTEALDKALRGL